LVSPVYEKRKVTQAVAAVVVTVKSNGSRSSGRGTNTHPVHPEAVLVLGTVGQEGEDAGQDQQKQLEVLTSECKHVVSVKRGE
jgi:hypothetical protein